MMISCKEATKLISDSMDRPLSLRRRFALRLHLFMCRFCSRYRKQSFLIREAMRRLAHEEDTPGTSDLSLTPEARDRIKAAVEKKIDTQ